MSQQGRYLDLLSLTNPQVRIRDVRRTTVDNQVRTDNTWFYAGPFQRKEAESGWTVVAFMH